MKHLGLVALIIFLSAGCDYIAPVQYQSAAFSKSHPPTTGETTYLSVNIKRSALNNVPLKVYLETDDNWTVISKETQTQNDVEFVVVFELVPNGIGQQSLTLKYGSQKRIMSQNISTEVHMPSFFNEKGSTFPEMVEAPDEYIYGAHITAWIPTANPLIVTGHAASNICRKVSGALFNYAITRSVIDEDFFLVAGFASLPKDNNKLSALKDNLHIFEPTKLLKAQAETVIMLSEVISADTENYADSIKENYIKLINHNKLLSALSVLKSLSVSFLENPSFENTSTEEITAFFDAYQKEKPSANDIRPYISNPEKSLFLRQTSDWLRLKEYIDEYNTASDTQRAQINKALSDLLLYYEDNNLLMSGLNAVAENNGLLNFSCSNYADDADLLNDSLKTWAANNNGELSLILSSLINNKQESLTPVCGQDSPTVIPVPYYNGTDGSIIEFNVSAADIYGSNNNYAKELLGNSIQHEMRRDLIAASERFLDIYHKNLIFIMEKNQHTRNMNSTQFEDWLKTEVERQSEIVDEIGKVVDIKVKKSTNFQSWRSLIEHTYQFKRGANNYRFMADQIESNKENPMLNDMMEYTLIDSFLRNWDLSFVDNSMDSPYESWLNESRNQVWSKIDKQMRAININILPIVNESTVFKVRKDGSNFVITPYFIANFNDTVAVRSLSDDLIYYENSWNNRVSNYLEVENIVSENELSELKKAFVDDERKALDTLAEKVLSPAESKESWKNDFDSAGKPHLDMTNIERSLYISPKHTANTLIEGMWALWEGKSISKDDYKEFSSISINQIEKDFFKRVSSLNWPFADHYLYYYLEHARAAEEAKSNQAELEQTHKSKALSSARKQQIDERLAWAIAELDRFEKGGDLLTKATTIDKAYVEQNFSLVKQGKQPSSTSEYFFTYLIWKRSDVFENIIQTLTCLSSAYQLTDEDNIRSSEVKQKISSCRNLLDDMQKEGALKLVYEEAVIKNLFEKMGNLQRTRWDFSRLGRSLAQRDISEMISDIAAPALNHANRFYRQIPSKEMLSALVKLKWYSGEYRSALRFAMREIDINSSSNYAKSYLDTVASLEDQLLKALVYSGAQIDYSIFGRKTSDWVVQPESLEKIPYRFRLDEKKPMKLSFASIHNIGGNKGPQLFHKMNNIEQRFGQTLNNIKHVSIIQSANSLSDSVSIAMTANGEQIVVTLPNKNGKGFEEAFYRQVRLSDTELERLVARENYELISSTKNSFSADQTIFLKQQDRLYVLNGDKLNSYQPIKGKEPSLKLVVSDAEMIKTATIVNSEAVTLFRKSVNDEDIMRMLDVVNKFNDPVVAIEKGMLPENILTFVKEDDNAILLFRGKNKDSLLTINNGSIIDVLEGEGIYWKLDQIANNTVKKASSYKTKFLHIDTYPVNAKTVRMQLGETKIDVPIEELRNLQSGDGATPILDKYISKITSDGTKDIVFYRDSWDRAQPSLLQRESGGGNGGSPPPDNRTTGSSEEPRNFNIKLLIEKLSDENTDFASYTKLDSIAFALALNKKYKSLTSYIDDETDLAKRNIASIPNIKRPEDLGAYIPNKEIFKVQDYDIIENISKKLQDSGISISRSMEKLSNSNIMVISGHRDEELKAYLKEHIELGNFKDKFVALLSCYAKGSENINHLIVKEGGAKGVLFMSNDINPTAVQKVVAELSNRAATLKPGETIDFKKLFNESIDAAERNLKDHQNKLKEDIHNLRNNLIQVSSIDNAVYIAA